MKEPMIIVEIDGAISMYGAKAVTIDGEKAFEIPDMDKGYKYAMMLDGVPMCSKDLENWVLCLAIQGDGNEKISGKQLLDLLKGTGDDGL